MTVARYLTPSRVLMWERCPWAFKLAVIGKLDVEEPRGPLVLGSLIHEALVVYHADWPTDAAGVLGCVAAAAARLSKRFEPSALDDVRAEAAAALLDYHRFDARARGPEEHAELPLRSQPGPFVLACRADWVTRDADRGTATSDEFKTSLPPSDVLLLQATAAHAGNRAKWPDTTTVRHRVIAFRTEGRPGVVARTVDLTAETFRQTLRRVFAVAREIAAEREFPARPSPQNCRACRFAGCCSHGADLVDSTPF
jgi:hypothetical protein